MISLRKVLRRPENSPSIGSSGKSVDSESYLYASLLMHSSADVRIRAYELLATSIEATRPIRSSALSILSKHLVYLHGDTDPGHRGEISSVTKVLIDRLRRGTAVCARNLAKLDSTHQHYSDYLSELEQQEEFLDWSISFLEDELGPNCSFSRHISSLRALQLLAESGLDPKVQKLVTLRSSQNFASWQWKKSLHHQTMKSALWQLLLDPFEEVRAATALVLNLLLKNDAAVVDPYRDASFDKGEMKVAVDNAQPPPREEVEQTDSGINCKILPMLEGANRLAAMTNRADHADGVGRLLRFQCLFAPSPSHFVSSILECLEGAVGLSGSENSLPVEDFSLHGYLLGLKYILEGPAPFRTPPSDMVLKQANIPTQRLFKLCYCVWQAVRHHLCVDSPELSCDVGATGPFEGPKDFLSYSWRALRDSSLLMQAILQHLTPWRDETLLPDGQLQYLRSSYALCFEQLTALRHRGAFSTVAETFALCCEQFASMPSLRIEFQAHYQVRQRPAYVT